MNSMELFERRDELKSVITDLRAELKRCRTNNYQTCFCHWRVMRYGQTVKTLVRHTLSKAM